VAQLRQTRCLQLRGQLGHDQQIAPDSLLEPVYDLLRVGPAALKTGSECSFTARKLRFLAYFCLA
jgi:hypothetical protein